WGQICTSQTGCCASMPSLPSPNFAAFDVALHACDQDPPSCPAPTDQRPTTPALQSAAGSFSRSDLYSHYLVLITNGQPHCGSGTNGPCTDAQSTVQQLGRMGIFTTAVVPASSQLDNLTNNWLQGMALQGAKPNTNLQAPYYRPASTPAELTDTLGQITHQMANEACTLDPKTSSPLQIRMDSSALSWKGMQIPFDHNNGWDLTNSGSAIQLHGWWCDTVLAGDPQADLRL